MPPERPNPPDPIKRQLRQEAGFGCCKCGLPILQYHHIIEWAGEQHFRPVDMMVLCPTHHDEASKHAMDEAEQRKYKADPFNIRRGLAKGPLKVKQRYAAVELGGALLVGDNVGFDIDGDQIFCMSLSADQTMVLSAKLFDRTNTLIAEIIDNEWVSGDPMAWDIVSDWQYLAIREKTGHVNIEIDARFIPTHMKARFQKNNFEIRLSDDGIAFNLRDAARPKWSQNVQHIGLVNMRIAVNTTKLAVSYEPLASGGCFVGEGDRRQRLYTARASYDQLKRVAASALRLPPPAS